MSIYLFYNLVDNVGYCLYVGYAVESNANECLHSKKRPKPQG